jgi:tRNA pseudouridine13 synthase
MDSVMQEEGLELAGMRLKHFREPFFSKGDRTAFYVPANLRYEAEPDERHAGNQKLTLTFDLPRGCYATMLVKRVTARGGSRPAEPSADDSD